MVEKYLTQLASLPGVSGREEAVREEILRQLAGVCETRVDALGNVIAYKKGAETPKNSILLSAHMDEVGFIITYIEEDGTLRFVPVGGIDSRVAVGKALQVGDALLPGVIGIRAVHQQTAEERTKAPDFADLRIDIGAGSRGAAEAVVQLGDRAVFRSPTIPFGEGLLRGKALDNRAGCAILLTLLQEELPVDVTCVFTVQEETGCIGARTAANALQPQVAIVLETTTAADIAGVPPDRQVCKLGAGPVLSFMDRSTIYHSGLYQLALDTAAAQGLPVQIKAAVSGGNESKSLQVGGAGAKVLALSVATRYLHSPACLLAQSDLEQTLALLRALLPKAGAL